uniref:Type II secretion system protein n=1 Tax=Dictyoglomus thermophilum TaxID=14 RepID=A0A7C3RL56_DICTH
MKRGFTFLEVLISILILGIFMASFGVGLYHILNEDDMEKIESTCLELSERVIEDYRKTILANWTASFPISGNFASIGYTSYLYTISITNITNSLRQFTITVWNDANNNNTLDNFEGKAVLVSLISRRR